MIVTLKITLVRGMECEDKWAANIELDESATLEDLHFAIQEAVEFDNDHHRDARQRSDELENQGKWETPLEFKPSLAYHLPNIRRLDPARAVTTGRNSS